MNKNELARLGLDTDGLTPDADYVPNPFTADDGVHVDLVYRAYLQLEQINALGGISLLGGSRERLEDIYGGLEDGMDLLTAVARFGDDEQQQRSRPAAHRGREDQRLLTGLDGTPTAQAVGVLSFRHADRAGENPWICRGPACIARTIVSSGDVIPCALKDDSSCSALCTCDNRTVSPAIAGIAAPCITTLFALLRVYVLNHACVKARAVAELQSKRARDFHRGCSACTSPAELLPSPGRRSPARRSDLVRWVLISHGGVHWSYEATFSDPPLLLTVSGLQMVLNSISPGPRHILSHACIDPARTTGPTVRRMVGMS